MFGCIFPVQPAKLVPCLGSGSNTTTNPNAGLRATIEEIICLPWEPKPTALPRRFLPLIPSLLLRSREHVYSRLQNCDDEPQAGPGPSSNGNGSKDMALRHRSYGLKMYPSFDMLACCFVLFENVLKRIMSIDRRAQFPEPPPPCFL